MSINLIFNKTYTKFHVHNVQIEDIQLRFRRRHTATLLPNPVALLSGPRTDTRIHRHKDRQTMISVKDICTREIYLMRYTGVGDIRAHAENKRPEQFCSISNHFLGMADIM